MANKSMELLDLFRKVAAEEGVDTIREGVRILAQALMEEEVTDLVGAERFERGRRCPRPPPGWSRPRSGRSSPSRTR